MMDLNTLKFDDRGLIPAIVQDADTGKVLTHNYILNKIWSSALPSDTPSLRVFMATLRKKIEPDPSHPRYIQTHIGVGYRMIRQPDEEAGAESEA